MIEMKAVLCLLVCLVLVEARPSKDIPDNNSDEAVYMRKCYGFTCPKGTMACAKENEGTDHSKKETVRCKSKNDVLLKSFILEESPLKDTPDNNSDEAIYTRKCYGFTCPEDTVTCAKLDEVTDTSRKETVRCMSKNNELLKLFTKICKMCNYE
ncbi:uncharacterized protein LOC116172682 isoform X1 [Photinus pyralis]|uniref:uncharacterized protein LOC116172682 isoform X1 n=1 Tax=Photinus pyralis TaxID=7054 RepID=UPI00126751D9|nr:uncharacterized protein LOC116172682 isoform X1 [Photinus pyralis]